MRNIAAFAALTAILALVQGCAHEPRVYFEPVKTRGSAVDMAHGSPDGEPVKTREFVPIDFASAEVRVACQARISETQPIDGVRVAQLHLRVWVHNYSRHSVELRPLEFKAVDEIDRRYSPTEVRQDGNVTTICLARAPIRSSIDIVFRLPAGFDVESARGFKLLWGFRIDEREYRHETIFEAQRDQGFHDPFGGLTTGRM